jgi:simple sugar transport system permease protein
VTGPNSLLARLSPLGGGRTLGLLALCLLSFIVFGAMRPGVFITSANVESMLLQCSIFGVLSLAVALTMMTGGIDLSVNAAANLAAIVASITMTSVASGLGEPLAIVLAIIAAFAVGTACGAANGLLVAGLGCPPILVTLGSMTLFAGIGTVLTRAETIFGLEPFAAFARTSLLGIPLPGLCFLAAAAVLSLVLARTALGRYVYLYGASPSAARFSGIRVRWLLMKTYMASGILAALAGLLSLSITNSANVDFGSSYVLLAVLVAVMGGINPMGGSGKIAGVVAAVFLLQLLSTGLNLVYQSSGSNFLKEFAWGLSLLLVLALARAGAWRWRPGNTG